MKSGQSREIDNVILRTHDTGRRQREQNAQDRKLNRWATKTPQVNTGPREWLVILEFVVWYCPQNPLIRTS